MQKNLDSKTKEQIERKGKEVEPEFVLLSEQEQYYINLYRYFAKDGGEYNNEKGLLISGGVGTGKTLSMKVMQRIFGNFSVVSSRHIIREFMINGVKVIDEYGRFSFTTNQHGNMDYNKPKHICFDDMLLEEANAKFYGNQQNLMAEILLDRYDMFHRSKMITYATTNSDMKTLEATYGVRVRDRVREMMNYIILTGNTFRK